jgi:hypothetical protein
MSISRCAVVRMLQARRQGSKVGRVGSKETYLVLVFDIPCKKSEIVAGR